MSGGKHCHLYSKIQNVIDIDLFQEEDCELSEEKKQEIRNIYKAMVSLTKSVEYYESGDSGIEEIQKSIDELKKTLQD